MGGLPIAARQDQDGRPGRPRAFNCPRLRAPTPCPLTVDLSLVAWALIVEARAATPAPVGPLVFDFFVGAVLIAYNLFYVRWVLTKEKHAATQAPAVSKHPKHVAKAE